MIQGYKAYRCPHCKSDRCGKDANAGWDVVTQSSILLGEFDAQWCNDCGDVTVEEYVITDQAEIATIDAERAALRLRDVAGVLLDAARQAEVVLRRALTTAEHDALIALRRAIAEASGMPV